VPFVFPTAPFGQIRTVYVTNFGLCKIAAIWQLDISYLKSSNQLCIFAHLPQSENETAY
jgi:hypothetical protein